MLILSLLHQTSNDLILNVCATGTNYLLGQWLVDCLGTFLASQMPQMPQIVGRLLLFSNVFD